MARAILYGERNTQMVFDEAPKTIDDVMRARIKFNQEFIGPTPTVFILMDEDDYRRIERLARSLPIGDYRVHFDPTFKTDFFDICGIRFSTPELEAQLKANL